MSVFSGLFEHMYFCTRLWPSGFPGSCQSFSKSLWTLYPQRKWQPTPKFLPGKFYRQRSLAGYSPWCRKQLDMAECTHTDTIFLLGFSNALSFTPTAVGTSESCDIKQSPLIVSTTISAPPPASKKNNLPRHRVFLSELWVKSIKTN